MFRGVHLSEDRLWPGFLNQGESEGNPKYDKWTPVRDWNSEAKVNNKILPEHSHHSLHLQFLPCTVIITQPLTSHSKFVKGQKCELPAQVHNQPTAAAVQSLQVGRRL